jgi:hypothetical protein
MFFVRGARGRCDREEDQAEECGSSSVFHTVTSR